MKGLPMPGGELEYAVLGVIWDFDALSAPEIYARLGEPKGFAYTTIAKVLDRLFAKGLVSRVRTGKSY
jgi:predicted transcriptional regulator